MDCAEILERLRSLSNPDNVKGMGRFGISTRNTLGVSMPELRKLAKEIGKHHDLAQQLWKSGIHEAKIVAGIIDEPGLVTEKQMDAWVKDFDSWDVCDQVCMNLFDKTSFAYKKAVEWSSRQEEFVKRAAFALMASLAVHDRKAEDEAFLKLLPIIKRESTDERNFVRKAVNWALRQIGKRNKDLLGEAIKTAKEIQTLESKSARWIASDALREFKTKQLRTQE